MNFEEFNRARQSRFSDEAINKRFMQHKKRLYFTRDKEGKIIDRKELKKKGVEGKKTSIARRMAHAS